MKLSADQFKKALETVLLSIAQTTAAKPATSEEPSEAPTNVNKNVEAAPPAVALPTGFDFSMFAKMVADEMQKNGANANAEKPANAEPKTTAVQAAEPDTSLASELVKALGGNNNARIVLTRTPKGLLLAADDNAAKIAKSTGDNGGEDEADGTAEITNYDDFEKALRKLSEADRQNALAHFVEKRLTRKFKGNAQLFASAAADEDGE